MNKELVEWQKIDPSNGLVYPWFTHPFLDVLSGWDLSASHVLEFGGGRSTAWWASKCSSITTVEHNVAWLHLIKSELQEHNLIQKSRLIYIPTTEGSEEFRDLYVNVGDQYGHFDIIVVDGIHRYECMQYAIKHLSDKGGLLIVDNWQQDGFICPACAELVESYMGYVYLQPDHTDHHGHPWQTAYWEITPYRNDQSSQ